jgi:hypothetical protein
MTDPIENLRPYVKALLHVQAEIHKEQNASPGSVTALGLAIGIGHALGDDPHFKRAAREDVARALRYVRDVEAGVACAADMQAYGSEEQVDAMMARFGYTKRVEEDGSIRYSKPLKVTCDSFKGTYDGS